jgi:ABC-type multidrug transport system ATPase subunit
MPETNMHIDLEKLSFGHADSDTRVFEEFSHRIEGPGFNALFGPSGVGKTTLARIIAGEMNGFSGKVASSGLSRILYTYNLERLPDWSGIGEHFKAVTPTSQTGFLNELTRIFGLDPYLESRYAQLSLGQQNRANLTRYLVQDFDVLIMDESLANVDEGTKKDIILLVKKRFPDRLFLYISHNVVEVSRYCKNILVVRRPDKSPQILTVSGFDDMGEQEPERETLERIMLEMMNAS